jgi:hypothetical protein
MDIICVVHMLLYIFIFSSTYVEEMKTIEEKSTDELRQLARKFNSIYLCQVSICQHLR